MAVNGLTGGMYMGDYIIRLVGWAGWILLVYVGCVFRVYESRRRDALRRLQEGAISKQQYEAGAQERSFKRMFLDPKYVMRTVIRMPGV
jgi:putative Mn2+ efflux pump MntP